MIEKPKQYYDTRRHQLYYQWRESEHFSHQEPIYDRTRDYIEALEVENAELQQKLSICQESEQEKVIEYLRQEIVDWEDKYRAIAAENAKLREMVRSVLVLRHDSTYKWLDATFAEVFGKSFTEQAHELGVETDK